MTKISITEFQEFLGRGFNAKNTAESGQICPEIQWKIGLNNGNSEFCSLLWLVLVKFGNELPTVSLPRRVFAKWERVVLDTKSYLHFSQIFTGVVSLCV